MNLKYLSILFGKWILLAILFTICFIIGTLISGLAGADQASAEQADSSAFLILVANSALTAALFAWPIIRSDWPWWKSVLALFLLLFSIGTLLPQLDSLFFSSPLGMTTMEVGTIIYSGAITALLYAPLSAWILHPQKRPDKDLPSKVSFSLWTIIGLSLAYVAVYFLFGYFVAWQSPDLREFYSGTSDILPFWTHLQATWTENPSLYGLQVFRGVIWVLLAYLIIWMMKGPKWEKVMVIALLFSLTGLLLLLMPNPYMPEVVRKVHFIELLSSNLLFGSLAGILLLKSQ